jgi:hypothetical protein
VEISELDSAAIGTFSLCIAGTVIGGVATYHFSELCKQSKFSQSRIGEVAFIIAAIASGVITFICPIAALGSITAKMDSSSQDGESYWNNFKIHSANWFDGIGTAIYCVGKCVDCAARCFKRTS